MRPIDEVGTTVRETTVNGAGGAGGVSRSRGLFDREILSHALVDALRKFNPRAQVRSPVMFVVLIGSIVTLAEAIAHPSIFTWSVTIWLVLTVGFANFAEALAEGRGKAQANALRRMRTETDGRRLRPDGAEERVAAAELVKGDLVIAEAGDVIPSDREIIEGEASVDESAITGESAPVIREAGGDRSAVTGGTTVLSDRIVVRITAERGHTFLDRMITLVEGASRRKTPNEIALTILLVALTIIFVPVVVVLQPFGHYAGGTVQVVILVALLVCLIPTTVGALLSAIGIAGMDRLVQRDRIVERVARSGATPLAVADGSQLLGVIELKDTVKPGIRERFAQMRAIGIRTVMITGDNPLTAAAIAQEAGVDDYLAEATPEAKMSLIKEEQRDGKLVAMTGDGTNDAPALAQADVGVAMNTGTTAAKEAGNMVDLDSNPTKLMDVVEIGKQLLITRGALTTFSIANDVAKYFAIIPALFAATYPQLNALNIMKLHSPQSAVLSAVIFNALIIVALIPLALRGVKFRPSGAAAILRRNVFIHGVGGIILPFIFIKLIDLILTATGAY